MNEEQFRRFMEEWGNQLSEVFKLELNQQYKYAPGFDGQAYSRGRNPQYAGSAPKSPFGQGNLSNSITTFWNAETETLEISMNDYGQYVNDGVQPQPQYLTGKGQGGNSPFIEALRQWAQRKGFQDPLGAAFGIRRNIWKYGIQPTNFFGNADIKIQQLFEQIFPTEFEDLFEQYLDKRLLNLIET